MIIILFPYILALWIILFIFIMIILYIYKDLYFHLAPNPFCMKRLYLKNQTVIEKNGGFCIISILTIIILSLVLSIFKGWLYTTLLIWLSLLYKFWSYHNNPQEFQISLTKSVNISSFILFFGLFLIFLPSLMLYIEDSGKFQIYTENLALFRYSLMQLIMLSVIYVNFHKPNTKDNRIKFYNLLSTLLLCSLSFMVIIEYIQEIILDAGTIKKDVEGGLEPGGDFKMEVSTTLPIIEGNVPSCIVTDRLILRRLELSDVEAHYTLRGQAEAMAHSRRGKPDANLEETLSHLQRMSDTYMGIFLKKADGSEGELIGDGGVHKFRSEKTGWPEFGYKFKKEYWGQGYATEFANAFMDYWQKLPRTDTRIIVASSSVIVSKDTSHALELVCAWTTEDNLASQNVLKKVGFNSFEGMNNGFINWQKSF